MINNLFLAFIFILIYEFFLFFNLLKLFKSSLKIYKKYFLLFKNNQLNELKKEKLIILYSKSLLQKSLKIILFFSLVGILLYLINYYFINIFIMILDLIETLKITLILIIYLFLKSKLKLK